MQRNVQFDPERALVEVRFQGAVTFQDRIETLDEFVPLATARGMRRWLVDFTQAWHGDEPLDAAGFAARLGAMRLLKGAAIAFLNAPDSHSVPTERVAERGAFHFKRFYTRAAAIRWLVQVVPSD